MAVAMRPYCCVGVFAALVGLHAERRHVSRSVPILLSTVLLSTPASALSSALLPTQTGVTWPSAGGSMLAPESPLRSRGQVLHAMQLLREIPDRAYDKLGTNSVKVPRNDQFFHEDPVPVTNLWSGSSFVLGLLAGILLTLSLFGVALKWGGLRAGFDDRQGPGYEDAEGTPQVRVNVDAEGVPQARVKASEPAVHCNAEDESIERFWPRCSVLMVLLMIQSISSVIMAQFHTLIESHASIVYFFTMLVGLGGNAGCQSVVLSVRKLAFGEVVSLRDQFFVGIMLSLVLAPLAYMRAFVQDVELSICLVIAISAVLITVIATTLGTGLPLLLHELRMDPAHSAPITQVAMDMIGILVVCSVGQLVVNSG